MSVVVIVWNALLSVKIGINYPQAIISMKLMKFTELQSAVVKGGRRVLRKFKCILVGSIFV